MKKLILVGCFVLGATVASFAQGGGGQGGRGGMNMKPEDRAKAMQTALKLTDDQTAKITAIYTAQTAKQDSIMKANNGDRQAAMGAMRPMREATNAKIKALLTEDQKAEFDKMSQRGGGRGQGGGQGGQGGGTPPPPPAK
ncbi:hypothetical protein HQ865_04020 [Mucilaginibacter mali]|uniref:LTXXQ motif family protein n=1 Tax=Mucilaginibacter mali TaxID=2740462 RepID=A0A7D4TKS2_9SPHI|nr:hypothetical protein [Mucilaginibacter mali]QKJ28953.1 hypothetical protein HQ865_04020 [Mucilaginibacter mali]